MSAPFLAKGGCTVTCCCCCGRDPLDGSDVGDDPSGGSMAASCSLSSGLTNEEGVEVVDAIAASATESLPCMNTALLVLVTPGSEKG